jgi:hypothetical protein
MNGDAREALADVSAGRVLFHPGTWGGPAGYRWCGYDGAPAGVVPGWENEVLEGLALHGLIATERRLGPFARRVKLTATGRAALHGLPEVA